MKALLLKDLYVLYKQMRYLLLVLILFCILPTFSATAFSLLFMIMLPVTTISYDEHSKWNQLAKMMPYTTRQLVFSKYLLGYLGAGIIFLISLISQLVIHFSDPTAIFADYLFTLILLLCVGLILLSVNLPLIFRFGPEKGRIIYILTCALIGGMTAAVPENPLSNLDLAPFAGVLVLLAIAFNWVSFSLSMKFYITEKA